MTPTFRTALAFGALLPAALGLAACGGDDDKGSGSTSAGSGGGEAKTIALLLPESKTARYEAQDRPGFTNELKRLCPDCKLIYSNADQDASKQQNRPSRPSRTARTSSSSTRSTPSPPPRRSPARSSPTSRSSRTTA